MDPCPRHHKRQRPYKKQRGGHRAGPRETREHPGAREGCFQRNHSGPPWTWIPPREPWAQPPWLSWEKFRNSSRLMGQDLQPTEHLSPRALCIKFSGKCSSLPAPGDYGSGCALTDMHSTPCTHTSRHTTPPEQRRRRRPAGSSSAPRLLSAVREPTIGGCCHGNHCRARSLEPQHQLPHPSPSLGAHVGRAPL